MQKRLAIISVVLILVLAVLLGLFLLWEYGWIGGTQQSTGEVHGQIGIEAGIADLPDETEEQQDPKQEAQQGTDLDSEQDQQDLEVQPEPQTWEISMVFAGDVMMGGSVRSNYDSQGLSGILEESLSREMLEADLAMVNQEFPFSTRGTPMEGKQYTFRVEPQYTSVFQEMGIDVVSLANNHALDYGTDALLDTFETLKAAEIPYVGAGESKEEAAAPVFVEAQGKTIGILSASRVIPVVSWNIENQQPGLFCTYDSAALVAAIEETRPLCDYLVIYVHWGVERQAYPEEYQRGLAQAYIDAGADLVVGSHPHVPQGIEYYEGKPIVYSLGNFIFNPNMVATYMLKVVWEESGDSHLQVIPVQTTGACTRELQGQEAADLLSHIQEISYDITVDEEGNVTH